MRKSVSQILIVTVAFPILLSWVSISESPGQQPLVLPLGHGSCWHLVKVTDFYTANLVDVVQIFLEDEVRTQPGDRNFSSTQFFPIETHTSGDPCCFCRIVNVNSISTQLNHSHLYNIWMRAIWCAVFIIVILVGSFPRGCHFLIGRIQTNSMNRLIVLRNAPKR